jgi:hypothetical protein
MKKALLGVGVIVVLILVFGLLACGNGGASSGTLTVVITGTPPGADGKGLYMGLYKRDADPSSASLLAVGDILLGTEFSEVMKDSITGENIVFDPGHYDLYLWIDMNDNMDTVQGPEQNIDMTHISFPFPVTIDGDTTVTVTANAFELFPG